jgi:ribosomal-protein-alanine N-acetyltransferase
MRNHRDREKSMKIRTLGQDEKPALLAFIELLDQNFKPPLSTQVNIAQWLKKVLKHGMILVSGERHDLKGVVAFYCNKKGDRQAFITYLGVANGARRRGLGRRLIEEALRVCRHEGMRLVLVTAGADNSAAISLYRKIGFKDVDAIESEQSCRISLRFSLEDGREVQA